MVGSSPHQRESMSYQRHDDFLNLECERDWEGSVHTTHTCRSHSRVGSHISQEQHNRAMQWEIDQLKRKLHHARQEQTLSNHDFSSESEEDASYRQKSRTPPSESFSYNEKHHRKRGYKRLPHKGLGNDTMSKAFNQISRSPFTCKIEGAKLPWGFHQPTFTIYNGQTDPVEHVSHFN